MFSLTGANFMRWGASGIECGKRLRKAAMNLVGASKVDDEDAATP